MTPNNGRDPTGPFPEAGLFYLNRWRDQRGTDFPTGLTSMIYSDHEGHRLYTMAGQVVFTEDQAAYLVGYFQEVIEGIKKRFPELKSIEEEAHDPQ